MAIELFANNATTTLNGGINSAVTSLVVASAAAFPSSGNFRILIDSEYMLVTAVSGTTFTVTRAAEGSTAASHANGATVTCILTAGAVGQLRVGVGALVTNNSAQSIADNVEQVLVFTATVTDPLGLFASNKFTIPTGGAGWWLLSMNTYWSANNNGQRIIHLRVNGSTEICAQTFISGPAGNDPRMSISRPYYLNDADYVEATGFQNGIAAPLDMNTADFSIVRWGG
jgi:hypothetical protein